MIQKKWFRVEHQKDGSISCDEVEAKGKNGAVVRYYEALTKEEACYKAKQWWDKAKERYKEYSANRRASGICSCGKTARLGMCKCQDCADKSINRKRARKLGVLGSWKRKSSAEEALKARRDTNAKHNKLRGGSVGSVCRTALRKLDSLGHEDFRKWLVSEINKRSAPTHQVN